MKYWKFISEHLKIGCDIYYIIKEKSVPSPILPFFGIEGLISAILNAPSDFECLFISAIQLHTEYYFSVTQLETQSVQCNQQIFLELCANIALSNGVKLASKTESYWGVLVLWKKGRQ